MARKKAAALQRVHNLARMGVSPASQGLNEEGEPLPDPVAIDLPAADADKDADGGEETKTAEEEPHSSSYTPLFWSFFAYRFLSICHQWPTDHSHHLIM